MIVASILILFQLSPILPALFVSNNISCVPCPIGTEERNGVCEPCRSGFIRDSTTNATCSQCPSGYETAISNDPSDHDSISDCRICPKGTYTKNFEGLVRLGGTDPRRPYEGRVEIFYNGAWGSVDNDYWDMQDAQVVCRQLGMGDAVEISEGSYGESEGIQWGGFECIGDELALESCEPAWTDNNLWGVMDYGSSSNPNWDDAGVVCSHDSNVCILCPSNSYSNVSGSSQCSACPSGYTTQGSAASDRDNASKCQACPIGISSKDGSCSVCPSGLVERSGLPYTLPTTYYPTIDEQNVQCVRPATDLISPTFCPRNLFAFGVPFSPDTTVCKPHDNDDNFRVMSALFALDSSTTPPTLIIRVSISTPDDVKINNNYRVIFRGFHKRSKHKSVITSFKFNGRPLHNTTTLHNFQLETQLKPDMKYINEVSIKIKQKVAGGKRAFARRSCVRFPYSLHF